MAKCDYCNSMILFGGKEAGGRRFCNDNCLTEGHVLLEADRIPQRAVDRAIREVHQGECPKCEGPGPVDIHVSHSIFSLIAFTSWKSEPHVCCRSCGRKAQAGSLLQSLFLGWWGFPYGIVMTPIQICRNISGMTGGPDPDEPTEQLETMVRIDLVGRIAAGESISGSRREDRIDVYCEACSASFTVSADKAGRRGRCRECREPLIIPEPDVWESDDEDESDDDYFSPQPKRPRTREPKKSSSVVWIVVAVLVGVFLVLPIGAAIVFALLDDGPERPREQFADNPPNFEVPQQPAVPNVRPEIPGNPPAVPGTPENPATPGFVPGVPDRGFGRPNFPGSGAPGISTPPTGFGGPTGPGTSTGTGNATGPVIPTGPGTNIGGRPSGLPASPGGFQFPDSGLPVQQVEGRTDQFQPEPVEKLENADPEGTLWVVLSNAREVRGTPVNPGNCEILVDYQVARGAFSSQGQPSPRFGLKAVKTTNGRPLAPRMITVSPTETSGTLRIRYSRLMQPGSVEFTLVTLRGFREDTVHSGILKAGQKATAAIPSD
jgi:hypothetical protein